MTNPDRLHWVDVAKTLAIFLVVIGHDLPSTSPLRNFIYSFHVPLFFLLSGFLAGRARKSNRIEHQIQRLLVPYLIWAVLSVLVWGALSFATGAPPDGSQWIKSGIGVLLGVGYDTEFSLQKNGPLWFLVGLFVVNRLSVLFRLLPERQRPFYAPALAILLAFGYIGFAADIDLWWSIDSGILALPFYVVGWYWGGGAVERLNRLGSPILICLFFLGAALSWVLAPLVGPLDLNRSELGRFPPGTLLLAFVGIASWVCLSLVLGRVHCLRRVSFVCAASTMTVLATHRVIQVTVEKLWHPQNFAADQTLLMTVGIALLAIGIGVALDLVVRLLVSIRGARGRL